MNKQILVAIILVAAAAVFFVSNNEDMVAQQEAPAAVFSIAAISGQVGGQDILGGYDVAVDWPKDINRKPGDEEWTWGAGQGIYAESEDRVYALMRGQLPNIERPTTRFLTDIAPSLSFPIGRLPWRDATAASLPANGGTGALAEEGISAWLERGLEIGVDARWDYCVVVFDAEGNVIEEWTSEVGDCVMPNGERLQRPHFIGMDPYDSEKHVWLLDDHKHTIYKLTNDGSEIIMQLGTYGEPGDDENHFNRPSMMDWMPEADGRASIYVADGYNGTRVVKFDADGNYMTQWGEPGARGGETRPGYWHNVHGISVDPEGRRVFVNDRTNNRVQVFDEDGGYLYEWSFGPEPADIHDFRITADGFLWAADRGTNKMLKYALDGTFLYSWGTWGDFPGGFWGVHGISSDPQGNFYVAEVDNGGFQKYTPRDGANPATIVGAPKRSDW
jgi:hypothetical protein